MSDYENKRYNMVVSELNNDMRLRKTNDSDWCEITMTTNRVENGEITIKSKEMAEALHFMLGQMLGKS